MKTTTQNLLAIGLLTLGMSQMAGAWLGLPILRGIGATSAAAPYPKVFSDVNGLETFASEFTLYIKVEGGGWRTVPVDPALYTRLGGSYNRRNVYGAALSYGPRLPEELWSQILAYGWSEHGPLRSEMGLPPTGAMVVGIKTRTRGRGDRWMLSLDHDLAEELQLWLERKGDRS